MIKNIKATHDGVIDVAGVSINCHVLEDGRRVLSTRGIMKAIGRPWRGRSYSGTELPVFLEANNLKQFINSNLEMVLTPISFEPKTGKPGEGFEYEALLAVCDVYLDARKAGALLTSQETVADRCEILVRAFSRLGLLALIDEATGYQEIRPRDALQAYLKKILSHELAAWAKKFPDEFYKNIYKLKGWEWHGMSVNRYSVVAHYTNDLVYERMAPGLLKELRERTPKNDKGERDNKLHQWLSEDIGNPMLAQHLHTIINFQKLAIVNGHGWDRFIKTIDQVMPKKGQTLEMELPDPNI